MGEILTVAHHLCNTSRVVPHSRRPDRLINLCFNRICLLSLYLSVHRQPKYHTVGIRSEAGEIERLSKELRAQAAKFEV